MFSTDLLETSILQYMEKLPTEDGRTLWQCTLCGKHHHLKHVISDHVEALHLSDIEFECPYCQKKKKSRSNLRAHISTYHREEHQMSKHSDFLWWTKDIVCFAFEIHQLMTKLTNFHLFVQPIGIHDIFISFAPLSGDFRDGLLGHMMTRIFKEELGINMWRCTVCQKEHKSKTLIRDHVEVAIFSKDFTLYQVKAQHFKNIDYSCDHCGKVYKTRDSFKKHVAVHKRNPGFFGRGAYNSSKGEEREIVTGPGYDFEDGQESYENTDNWHSFNAQKELIIKWNEKNKTYQPIR